MSHLFDLLLKFLGYDSAPSGMEGMNRMEAAFCRALAETMYPRGAGEWPCYDEAKVLEETSYYLKGVYSQKRLLIGLLLTFSELAPLLRPPFRRFTRLTPEKRLALLEGWNTSRIAFLNLCAASLRSLLNLAYLSNPKVLDRIGEGPRQECRESFQPRRSVAQKDGTFEGILEFPALEGKTIREQADFVVVGTGPGGAVVAKELAEAGRSVIAIEEGPFYRAEEHSFSTIHTMRNLFAEQGLRYTSGNTPVRTFQARVLGGTSVVNSAICWRAPQIVFDEWRQQYGIDNLSREILDPFYDRAEKEASVAPTPEDAWGRKGRLFQAGCKAMGVDCAPTNRAVRGCRGCSECFHGCAINAKQSMDRCYIPSAIEHGARFYTSCRVEELIYEHGRVAGVRAYVLNPNTHRRVGQVEVRAKAVILCAGVMASPLLLLKNRLPGISSCVGRNLCFHTGLGIGGVFEEEVNPWTGGTQDWHSLAYLPEDLHLEVLWGPSALLMARTHCFGTAFHATLKELKHTAFWCFSGPSFARGRLTAGRDWEPRLRFDLSDKDVAVIKRGMDVLVDHFFAAGAVSVHPGLGGFDPEIRTTAQIAAFKRIKPRPSQLVVAGNHVYGTCAMGADPSRSVIDSNCAVRGISDLYICDTSIFPSPTKVNPQLTIMAMAGWLANQLNKKY